MMWSRLFKKCARKTSSNGPSLAAALSFFRFNRFTWSKIAHSKVAVLITALYSKSFLSPTSVPRSFSQPGSLKHGSATKINDWMLTITCSMVECCAFHPSPSPPDQVPSNDKHTLPSLYRFGLNRTRPPPVVFRLTKGGLFGKSEVSMTSKMNAPES